MGEALLGLEMEVQTCCRLCGCRHDTLQVLRAMQAMPSPVSIVVQDQQGMHAGHAKRASWRTRPSKDWQGWSSRAPGSSLQLTCRSALYDLQSSDTQPIHWSVSATVQLLCGQQRTLSAGSMSVHCQTRRQLGEPEEHGAVCIAHRAGPSCQ